MAHRHWKQSTKKRIAKKAVQIIREAGGELISRETVYRLSQNGFKDTFINSTNLTNVLKMYAPCIEISSEHLASDLRQTSVTVYRLKGGMI